MNKDPETLEEALEQIRYLHQVIIQYEHYFTKVNTAIDEHNFDLHMSLIDLHNKGTT